MVFFYFFFRLLPNILEGFDNSSLWRLAVGILPRTGTVHCVFLQVSRLQHPTWRNSISLFFSCHSESNSLAIHLNCISSFIIVVQRALQPIFGLTRGRRRNVSSSLDCFVFIFQPILFIQHQVGKMAWCSGCSNLWLDSVGDERQALDPEELKHELKQNVDDCCLKIGTFCTWL